MPATAQGSLVVIGGSDLLFYAFLAAICVDVVQLTGIGIALIVANVLFWRALGAFTGMFAILLGGSSNRFRPNPIPSLPRSSLPPYPPRRCGSDPTSRSAKTGDRGPSSLPSSSTMPPFSIAAKFLPPPIDSHLERRSSSPL